MTVTYLTIVLCQFMNILSRRVGEVQHVFTSYLWSNKRLLWSFVVSLAIIASLVYIP
ncbi:MAG: cation transporting ATPase C-terminal domain-containing protein [Candidatus Peribacteria bacterium]|nr:MAG: cation transporting ATPase C-terminal domain-containing protein [Candidatus Peribacteria bacterium]